MRTVSKQILDQRLNHLSESDQAVLADLKEKLVRLLVDRPFRLILFGSKARGDHDHTSDLDVTIIVSGLDRTLKRDILNAVADVELDHLTPISAFVLSSEEFRRLLNRERRIALDIEQEGIML